jgi:hypothetical protein
LAWLNAAVTPWKAVVPVRDHWVMLPEPTTGEVHTAYASEGYMVGGDFTDLADNFSDPAEQVVN